MQLNDACKVQQTKIKLTAAYDDMSRKLQSSVEQFQVTIKKLQVYEQELSTIKLNLEAATKDRAMMETLSALHKKDRAVKELLLQSEEDRKNIILQESLDKLYEKIKMYKKQFEEQECKIFYEKFTCMDWTARTWTGSVEKLTELRESQQGQRGMQQNSES